MELALLDLDDHITRFEELKRIKDPQLSNFRKVEYSRLVLNSLGKTCEVNPPRKKSMKMKLGRCYTNSILKRKNGFEYVEGIVTEKKSGYIISHSWNIDSDGNQYDFTLIDTENYDYFGIYIPFNLLEEIGERNGHIWSCALPYLKITHNK